MRFTKPLLAAVPLLSLGAASLVTAAPSSVKLLAGYTVDGNVPNGTVTYDCAQPAGHRAHIQAFAMALDSCGNPVQSTAGEPTFFSAATAGVTQAITIHSPTPPTVKGPCGGVARHVVQLQEHLLDNSNGTDTTTPLAFASPSSDWAGRSETSSVTINSALSNGGSCQDRHFKAASQGF